MTAKKPRMPKGHKLPDPFLNGEILKDLKKKQWKIGNVIGQGGFGLIYMASDDTQAPVSDSAQYVIKIEPQSNGPLFCEIHFYKRVAKEEMVNSFKKERKLKYLGVPILIGSGCHLREQEKYRFMVIQRFGTDLQKLFVGKSFSKHTVYCLALRLLDILEYIHKNNYVHADVKAANLLLGYSGGKDQTDQVYLVDYGLAYKYCVDGKHKEYKEDPKRAHDGTIEFTSIDAHKGLAPARRGDLEILGYCLLQWLCGVLPWEDKLTDPNYVRDSKIKYMKDIPSLMKKCFPAGNVPEELSKYLVMVKELQYEEEPDYGKLRDLFKGGLKKMGWKDEWIIDLPLSGPRSSPKKAVKRKNEDSFLDSPRSPKVKKKSTAANKKDSTPKVKVVAKKSSKKVTPARKQVKSPAASSFRALSASSVKSPLQKSPRMGAQNARSTKSVVLNGSPRKVSTKRFVKRRKAVTVDASIQTSPGFGKRS